MTQSFKKSDRLLSEADFRLLFDQAHKRSRERIFSLKPFRVYWNGSEAPARLGISISKKLSKRAVDRNRLKRLIREFFRHQKQSLSGDFLVKLDTKTSDFSFEMVYGALAKISERKFARAS